MNEQGEEAGAGEYQGWSAEELNQAFTVPGAPGPGEEIIGTLGAEDFVAPEDTRTGWLGRSTLQLAEAFLGWTHNSRLPTYNLSPLAAGLHSGIRRRIAVHQAHSVMAARSRVEARANSSRPWRARDARRAAERLVRQAYEEIGPYYVEPAKASRNKAE